jgi:hypothetical protein
MAEIWIKGGAERVEIQAAWLSDAVIALALRVGSGDAGAVPILADALEDSGCENQDLLSELRHHPWAERGLQTIREVFALVPVRGGSDDDRIMAEIRRDEMTGAAIRRIAQYEESIAAGAAPGGRTAHKELLLAGRDWLNRYAINVCAWVSYYNHTDSYVEVVSEAGRLATGLAVRNPEIAMWLRRVSREG